MLGCCVHVHAIVGSRSALDSFLVHDTVLKISMQESAFRLASLSSSPLRALVRGEVRMWCRLSWCLVGWWLSVGLTYV